MKSTLVNTLCISMFLFFVVGVSNLTYAQEARKLTGKKWKFDLLEIVKEMDFSMTVLDSLSKNASYQEKITLRNLKIGIESMLKFIPSIGNTTFEFKRNGDLLVVWEGKQVSKGKWRMEGRQLIMQIGDDDEDIVTIRKLTDSKLEATTENDSALHLVSMD
jgi:hypothetical protein